MRVVMVLHVVAWIVGLWLWGWISCLYYLCKKQLVRDEKKEERP